MHWDGTINVGDALAAAVLLTGLITAHRQNLRRLESIESRLNLMYRWWERHIIGVDIAGDDK